MFTISTPSTGGISQHQDIAEIMLKHRELVAAHPGLHCSTDSSDIYDQLKVAGLNLRSAFHQGWLKWNAQRSETDRPYTHGLCIVTSYAIKKLALPIAQFQIQSAMVIDRLGNGSEEPHHLIRLGNGILLDITCDQFGLDPVLAFREDEASTLGIRLTNGKLSPLAYLSTANALNRGILKSPECKALMEEAMETIEKIEVLDTKSAPKFG